MAISERITKLIADFRQYAQEGTNERMRPRCSTAADSLEAGCSPIALRDELVHEVYRSDESTAAYVMVSQAVFSGAVNPTFDRKEAASRLRGMANQLNDLENTLLGTADLEAIEARRHMYSASVVLLLAAEELEGKDYATATAE